MNHTFGTWTANFAEALGRTEVTFGDGTIRTADDGVRMLMALMGTVQDRKRKFIFIGNGGSSAIAGHMAEDFTKTAHVRAVTFNDPALLTCFANDFGWDHAYHEAVFRYMDPGDVLVAISSSGESNSIVNATHGLGNVVTLSGFGAQNRLRAKGVLNFYVPSMAYGHVETAHAAILHAALDIFVAQTTRP